MKRLFKNKVIIQLSWIILLLIFWEVSSRFGLVSQYLLPPFSKIVIKLMEELKTSNLTLQVLNSLLVVIQGFIISFMLAIILTILCTWSEIFESFCDTLCTIFNPLPGMAILPIVIIWFGMNTGSMLALIVHGVLWPLLTNLLIGFKSTPQIYKDFSRNIGLSPLRTVCDVLLFSVMPYLISGIKIAWGRAWRALISAEMVFGMIGTLGGLGFYIYTNRAYGNITCVFVGVIIITIIGIIVDKLFAIIEKNTIVKWGMVNE